MSNLNFLHSGGNKVTLSAPDSNPSSDVTLKLPQADGSKNQALSTNGSGVLSFATVSLSQHQTVIQRQIVPSNYLVPTGHLGKPWLQMVVVH